MTQQEILLSVMEKLQALMESTQLLVNFLDSQTSPPLEPAEQKNPPHSEEGESPTSVTFEQLRGAMAGKSQQGKKAEVKALLTKYGVEKLSDLPMEAYSKVMAEVEALE
ncbi:MAG: hypothetical protein R3Y63_04825 [Eubacteriales bacterium]